MSRAFVSQSLYSTALCFFAAVILATSIISTNRTVNGAQQRLSTLEFYWGKQVLPDHALYPVLMVRDRLRLVVADEAVQPAIRLQYAEHRYQVAHELAFQHKTDLAISALCKSQTYVLDAARQLSHDGLTATERAQLAAALDHSLYRLALIHEQYPAVDAPMLRSLKAETAGLLEKLR